MAEQGRQLPPGHRLARLALLGALVGVLAAGGLSDDLAAVATSAGRWGGDVIGYLWAPVRDALGGTRPAEPTTSPTPTSSPKRKQPAKPTPKPTKSRAG